MEVGTTVLEDFILGICTLANVVDNNYAKFTEYSGPIENKFADKFNKDPEFNNIDDTIPRYAMNGDRIVVLVNNIKFDNLIKIAYDFGDREEAEHDTESLIEVFCRLKFRVFLKENCKRTEFIESLKQLLNSEDVKHAVCFMLVFMSHGTTTKDNVEKVAMRDGLCDTDDIIDCFKDVECPALRGKPKVLIFMCCRGDKEDGKDVMSRIQSETVQSIIKSNAVLAWSDMRVWFCTNPKTKAWREKDYGSWFIQTFCRVLSEHWHNTHLEDLTSKVNEELVKKYHYRHDDDCFYVQTTNPIDYQYKKLWYFFKCDGRP